MKQESANSTKTPKLKIVLLALGLVVILALATACGGGSDKKEEGGGGASETVDVSLIDTASAMSVDPAEVSVASGTDLTLNVTNDGTVVHNLTIDGGAKTADLQPFAAGELKVGTVEKETVIYCSIAGHREQGMEMKVTVK